MALAPVFIADKMPDADKNELYAAVTEWHKVATELAALAAREKLLRIALCDAYFPTHREGANTGELGFGRRLKMEMRINRKIDAVALDAAISGQTIEPDTINSVIDYKPNLKAGEWKKLDAETRALFGDIVTEAPGTPSLSIEVIKS